MLCYCQCSLLAYGADQGPLLGESLLSGCIFLTCNASLTPDADGAAMPKCYAPHHDSWHCHPDILTAEYRVHEYMSVAYIRTASHPAKQIGKSDAVIPAA